MCCFFYVDTKHEFSERFQHNSCLNLSCDPIIIIRLINIKKISITLAFFVLLNRISTNINKFIFIAPSEDTNISHFSVGKVNRNH